MIESVGPYAAPLLAALHARTFPRPWSEADFAKLLGNPATIALLARDEAPIGFALLWVAAGEAELLSVSVIERARRAGIGGALLAAAAAEAEARGAGALHLEVAEDNSAARALYLRHGFAEVGRRRDYYQTPVGLIDAIVMRRKLSEPHP